MELCCNQPMNICKSFSYFLDLKVCYLMNVTQFVEFVILQPAVSFKHFHRSGLKTTSYEDSSIKTMQQSTITNQFSNYIYTSSKLKYKTLTLEDKTISNRVNITNILVKHSTFTKQNTSPITTTKNDKIDITEPNNNNISFLKPTDQYSTTLLPKTSIKSTKSYIPPDNIRNDAVIYIKKPPLKEIETTAETQKFKTYPNAAVYLSTVGYMRTPTKHSGVTKNLVYSSSAVTINVSLTTQTLKKGKVPMYIIVVSILASIFVILIVMLLVFYILYRKRTGKYRVTKTIHKWIN